MNITNIMVYNTCECGANTYYRLYDFDKQGDNIKFCSGCSKRVYRSELLGKTQERCVIEINVLPPIPAQRHTEHVPENSKESIVHSDLTKALTTLVPLCTPGSYLDMRLFQQIGSVTNEYRVKYSVPNVSEGM